MSHLRFFVDPPGHGFRLESHTQSSVSKLRYLSLRLGMGSRPRAEVALSVEQKFGDDEIRAQGQW